MSLLVTTLALSFVQACPSYETCAFLPMNGTNPSTEQWNTLFESASKNELGAASPEYPNIEVGPNRVQSEPVIACQILKPIAAAESIWQQFCPETNKTVISFDCGFGAMQVTSGAAAYGPMLASDSTWNVGAGAQILINKWNGEFRGGPIGDSDPMILENWYYAVWAYNGFVYGNNPDNPQLPPNRPPFNGPNSLSRGSYPYQEIVWGYMHYPLDWRTTPKWEAVPVSYPAPGQVGSDPGPLAKLEPEHRSECKEPCDDDNCDFELIIDDLDDAFRLTGSASVSATGGYKDQFRYAAGHAALVRAAWTMSVPKTAIYRVGVFVPQSTETLSMSAPVHMMVRGATLTARFDQTRPSGLFYKIGDAKLLKDQEYELVMSNQSDEINDLIAFDATRIIFDRLVGTGLESEECLIAADCEAELVCVHSICRPGCEITGCADSSCNPITGLCDEVALFTDAGVIDAASPPRSDADASMVLSPNYDDEESCSCRSANSSKPSAYGFLWALLALIVFRRPRRVRLRPSRPRYTS
jgi:MYXO-CTERM domain-containing protein